GRVLLPLGRQPRLHLGLHHARRQPGLPDRPLQHDGEPGR
ncbi:MAG: hypothetical protein AVDCRST_MAG89-121, partial [uncultured Gemmatimonadetes bacterium]